MTSIEWLIEQFNLQAYTPHIEKAKEMHKAELGKTWDAALDAGQSRAWNVMRAYEDFDEWYETFVSKGSNDHIVDTNEMVDISQQETLYTEEQVREAISKSVSILVGQEINLAQLKELTIQSLKQPKQ